MRSLEETLSTGQFGPRSSLDNELVVPVPGALGFLISYTLYGGSFSQIVPYTIFGIGALGLRTVFGFGTATTAGLGTAAGLGVGAAGLGVGVFLGIFCF